MTLTTFFNERWVAITCLSVLTSVLSVGVLRDSRSITRQGHKKKASSSLPNRDNAEDILWYKEIFFFWIGVGTLISTSLGAVLMVHLGAYQDPHFRLKAISYTTVFFAGTIAVLESYGKVRDHSFRTSLVHSLVWATFVAHEFTPGRSVHNGYYPICNHHVSMISFLLNVYVIRKPKSILTNPIAFATAISDLVLPVCFGMGAEYGQISLNVSPCRLNSFLLHSVNALLVLAIFVEVDKDANQEGEKKKYDFEQSLLDNTPFEEVVGLECATVRVKIDSK